MVWLWVKLSLSLYNRQLTDHRPFYASLGIMTTRLLLHLLKSTLQDGELDIIAADLNWTVDQTHETLRTSRFTSGR